MAAARCFLLLAIFSLTACNNPDTQPPQAVTALAADQLAVIVNDRDPESRAIADYYAARRQIPGDNIIHVGFEPGIGSLQPATFQALRATVSRLTPARVQAYALAWTTPFRVGCMSVTTAFAAGYDTSFCATTCAPTRESPYFDSDSQAPWTDFGWRPSMLLAGTDSRSVHALIERGIAADASHPRGSAYLVSTSDRRRNTRARFYGLAALLQSGRFNTRIIATDSLRYRSDVMFYFTGLSNVKGLDSLSFLPGAIADHLTSSGGVLTGSKQMSSLRWLDAGATASYGTVREPCSYTEKFPRPDIVMEHYLNGASLIEAYWKSVQWPGQGVFIGEPLAKPFAN